MPWARYCRPSRRSASVSMWGAAATSCLGLADRCSQRVGVHRLETRTCSKCWSIYLIHGGSISGTVRGRIAGWEPLPRGRASPPTDRVLRVLDFLSQRPHERFGVSELARRAELSKPTCLGIVTALDGCRLLDQGCTRQDVSAGAGPDHARPQGPGVDADQPGRAGRTAPAVDAIRHHGCTFRGGRRPDHAARAGRAARVRGWESRWGRAIRSRRRSG